MKLFRLRFILLGLLLCIFHVWCRTCGSDFDDPESKAYLADVIIEGKLSQKLQTPGSGDRYNSTVRVRKVIKGQNFLGSRKPRQVTVGNFGPVLDDENCVSNLTRDNKKYYFFLNKTIQRNYLILSAFPEKVSRRIGRKIRKVSTCKNCVKAPKIRKIKGKKSVKEGGRLQLRCQISAVKPPAVIQWEKDGVILTKRKGLQIKNGRKGSRLKIKKSTSADSGNYVCVVTNAVSTDRQSVNIKILPKNPSNINSTREPGVTVTPRFKPCPPEDRGYCLNNGECRIIVQLDYRTCKCPREYNGERCEALDPSSFPDKDPRRAALEKDRTLTIIGIVIGLLLFICICIASYFLAKRRRDRFYRRQEEKRRQSVAASIPNPPPSYHKLPSIDTELGYSFSKQRPFERSYKNSETQTEDSSNVAPNPHTNINLYHNPMENSNLLRNPPSNRNSRTRLSGVSAGKRDSDRPTSSTSIGSKEPSHRGSLPDNNQAVPPRSSRSDINSKTVPQRRSSDQNCKNNRNSVPPKIRHVSDMDMNSDDENADSLTPLHISEDDIRGQSTKNQSKDMLSPVRDDDTSSSYSSDGSVSSSVENLRHLNNVRDGDMSWNERGSPEPVHRDSYRNGSDNNQFHFLNSDNGYLKLAKFNKDRNKRHISDHDSKSIPV